MYCMLNLGNKYSSDGQRRNMPPMRNNVSKFSRQNFSSV